jgi:hypothetical protein
VQLLYRHPAVQPALVERQHLDAEVAGQVLAAGLVQGVDADFGTQCAHLGLLHEDSQWKTLMRIVFLLLPDKPIILFVASTDH